MRLRDTFIYEGQKQLVVGKLYGSDYFEFVLYGVPLHKQRRRRISVCTLAAIMGAAPNNGFKLVVDK